MTGTIPETSRLDAVVGHVCFPARDR